MPRAIRSSATWPLTNSVRIRSAAATAASAAAARTTATQNSGSANMLVSSALERGVDRSSDGGRSRHRADQPLDNCGGGVDRDAAHIGHGGRLGGGDLLFGLGKLRVELRFQRLAAFL